MSEECFFNGILDTCAGPGTKLSTCSRIEKIIECSDIRGHHEIRQKLEPGYHGGTLTSIRCHKNCVSTYVSPTNLTSLKRKSLSNDSPNIEPKTLRSEILNKGPQFNFKKHCLFCLDVKECILPCEYDSKVPYKYRVGASTVVTKDLSDGVTAYKDVLIAKCDLRNDALGRVVKTRLVTILGDLPAEEARYHHACNRTFHKASVQSTDQDEDKAFIETCSLMSQDRMKIWNSLEVEQVYVERGGQKLTRRYLIDKLKIHFGGEIVSLHSAGIATLLVFRNHVAKTLRIVDVVDNDFDECVNKVGRQIAKECAASKQKLDSYSEHIDRTSASECVSEVMSKLLTIVNPKFSNSLQSIMVGNIVSGVCSNHQTPLQIAVGVLLGGHKSLITELYKFGVCCSYDEVRRFLRSAAVKAARDEVWAGLSDASCGGLVQVIIDNFDAVIQSQNCRLDCHCLAMLVTQPRVNTDTKSEQIPRLSKQEMTQPIECDIPVVQYMGPKKPEMPVAVTMKFEPSEEFQNAASVSLDRSRDIDFEFMHSILYVKDTPEHNGYNTRLCRNVGMTPATKSAVRYLPLINMIPSDPNCINTAVTHGLKITQDSNQNIMVMTCDQQLYKIVVDITFNTPSLLNQVVAVLGGMHFLMDFVGCIGSLTADNGTKAILSSTFGSVDKMLSGKKYPQNARALRLLTEEVLRPVFDRHGDQLKCMGDVDAVLTELSRKSRTSKMWVDLIIRPTFLIMQFHRASHEGDWPLHIITAQAMLPYMFAANHHNYARYGLYYVRSMTWLPREIEEKFIKGEQTMHHIAGIWNGMPTDQFIETTWMRKGHGPEGIIGDTQNTQTMATWVHSRNAVQTLTNDLQRMSGQTDSVQMKHKEEDAYRIRRDAEDRNSIRKTLGACIDPMHPESHEGGILLNISTGQIAQPETNVDKAVEIGGQQLQQFEATWPEGFYGRLSKRVVSFSSNKKHVLVGEHKVLDQEAIYARVIGLLVSNRDLDLQQVLSTELAAYPPSMFHPDGSMRVATGKSALKKSLAVEVPLRTWGSPTAFVIDVSAVLWTLDWPVKGLVQTFVQGFQVWLSAKLVDSDVYLAFDRYEDYSTKSSTRAARDTTSSRVHKLSMKSPLPGRDSVLKCTHNKMQLNRLLCEQILNDQEFLRIATKDHHLVISGEDEVPTQVFKGRRLAQMDLASKHEEADNRMTQQAIFVGQDPSARISVVADDTDVFVLLLHHYAAQKLKCSMIMQSPIHGRTCVDIPATVRKHVDITPYILAVHAISGCDTVAATYGVGKGTAISVARKGFKLDTIGRVDGDMKQVEKEATAFIVACYGNKLQCDSMTQCRQRMWALKTGKSTNSAPKLCSLPPTTEAFLQNVHRCHFQVAHWYGALQTDLPPMNPIEFGWEADPTNKSLSPCTVLGEVFLAPESVLKLIRCGCSSERACKGNNCGCTGRLVACSIFCSCGAGLECNNPFNKASIDSDEENADSEDVENEVEND